jgi:hypothetical protein
MTQKATTETPRWSAILDVRDPDGTRTRHPFRHPRVAIGRKRENDLMLPDDAISSRHCEFVSDHGFFVVRDVGSQNGTFVNGARADKDGTKLRDGDEVRIGETRIRVALQGQVKVPRRAPRLGLLPAVLAGAALFAVGIGYFLRQRSQEKEQRVHYLLDLRDHLKRDPCTDGPFEELAAIDQQIAGRSFAIGLKQGRVNISAQDEKDDRALLDLYRKKLTVFTRLESSLTDSQQVERESEEKLARMGARFSVPRDRKLALWAEEILRDREKAGDDLIAAVKAQHAQNAKLVALVEAVVVRREAEMAATLAHFRFGEDLKPAIAACEAQVARVTSAAAGAFSALDE